MRGLFGISLLAGCSGLIFAPQPFSDFQNESLTIGDWSGTLANGALSWVTGHKANFAVLSKLITQEEASGILSLLPADFDEDPDSVDKMLTYEFFLEKSGGFDAIKGIPGKIDNDPDVHRARRPTREKIARITRPIMRDRVVPFVNQRFAKACHGECTVCHSLVRRYKDNERRAHPMHFDLQALVTVVVSLNGDDPELEGGLYVGTSNHVQFVHLSTGEAIVHQSDLMHGVHVTRGDRWSWIMWIKDAQDCKADMAGWNRELADEGNPVGQFLQASRVHMGKVGMPNPGGRAREKFDWLLKAAQGGFPRAQNELGMAYKEGDGVRLSSENAEKWFDSAISHGESDAMFNKGLLYLEKGEFAKAVQLFIQAAEGGSDAAYFNLGVAYSRGLGGVTRDVEEALKWWKLDQSATACNAIYQLLVKENRTAEAGEWLLKAGQRGHVGSMVALGQLATELPQQELWLRRGARGGDVGSMVGLGLLLRRRGDKEGRAWLERAASMGDEQAKDILEPHRKLHKELHGEL